MRKVARTCASQQKQGADVGCGSISAETPCLREVHFPPDNDQIADITPRRRRANFGQSASQQTNALFDHLVGPQQKRFGDGEAEGFGGFEIDDELKLRWVLHR
jgi:hypothetical protein